MATTVAICLIARDEGAHIAQAVASLRPLLDAGDADDLVLLDGGSTDSTPTAAAAAGARVVRCETVRPDLGPLLGKGDVLWRGQMAVGADVLVVFDGDLYGDLAEMARRLLATLASPGVVLAKGYFVRSSSPDPTVMAAELALGVSRSGRVTETLARPLLELVAPSLAALREPLGGQIAIRAADLAALPVATGYGLEIGMIHDVGFDAIAEVDLGVLHNPPQPYARLEAMAGDVLSTLLRRAHADGTLPLTPAAAAAVSSRAPIDRPPLAPFGERGLRNP